jgi:hypothetical protein
MSGQDPDGFSGEGDADVNAGVSPIMPLMFVLSPAAEVT